MRSRFKKVSLALYLDPTQSAADHHAYQTMLGWANRRKTLAVDSAAAIELHQLVHIHKDIYLSGLYLHDLKPELVKSVAAALSADSVNSDALLAILKAHHIIEAPSADKQTPATAQLGAIEQQLAGLVNQQQQIGELKQLVAEQNKLIAELSGKFCGASKAATPTAQQDQPVSVEQRIASVKKAKRKGLF